MPQKEEKIVPRRVEPKFNINSLERHLRANKSKQISSDNLQNYYLEPQKIETGWRFLYRNRKTKEYLTFK